MGLVESFAIWNNKGGVGKSTITFHTATRYAELNPDKKVMVIDLCPQSNASMMFLGGGNSGESTVFGICSESSPKTVVGYISTVITNGQNAELPNPYDFVTKISSLNKVMPENLYLLCGDGNLEPMAPAINDAASARALTPSAKPWKWIHLIFRNFIDSLSNLEEDEEWTVFVDTNPSFSIYTELAISAVNQILVPINADNSSRTAANAMTILLHGTNPPHPIYGSWTFAEQAKIHGLKIPTIHTIVGNRLTQFDGPAAAFSALSDATSEVLYSIFKESPSYFTSKGIISSKDDFVKAYSKPLRDFNTAGVVCAHQGNRISLMKQDYYEVHGKSVKVNAGKIKECLKAIDALVDEL